MGTGGETEMRACATAQRTKMRVENFSFFAREHTKMRAAEGENARKDTKMRVGGVEYARSHTKMRARPKIVAFWTR